MAMMLSDILANGRVIVNISGQSKQEILRCMLSVLLEKRVIQDAEKLLEEFMEREAKGSTGIGNGIAIPHVRSDQVSEIEYVFANSSAGIDFESLDGEPVHILVMMVAPASSHGVHIKALARLSRLLNDELVRNRLRNAASADAVAHLIREREEEIT